MKSIRIEIGDALCQQMDSSDTANGYRHQWFHDIRKELDFQGNSEDYSSWLTKVKAYLKRHSNLLTTESGDILTTEGGNPITL